MPTITNGVQHGPCIAKPTPSFVCTLWSQMWMQLWLVVGVVSCYGYGWLLMWQALLRMWLVADYAADMCTCVPALTGAVRACVWLQVWLDPTLGLRSISRGQWRRFSFTQLFSVSTAPSSIADSSLPLPLYPPSPLPLSVTLSLS